MEIRKGCLVWAFGFMFCQFQQGNAQVKEQSDWHNDVQKLFRGVSIYASVLDLKQLNSSLFPAGILSVGPDFKRGKIWFSGRIQIGISGTSDTVFSQGKKSLYNWRRPLLYSGFEGEVALTLWNRPRTRLFLENTLSAGIYSNSILPIDAFGYHSLTFRSLFDELGFIFDYRFHPGYDSEMIVGKPTLHHTSLRIRISAVQSILTWPRIQRTGIHLMPGISLGVCKSI
ncbi:MAG TPA: hypothetical protein PLK63_00475 [Catalimonadaceae bacterium]|nr:hypothetical protein [Catalimonadaceae bacterium]